MKVQFRVVFVALAVVASIFGTQNTSRADEKTSVVGGYRWVSANDPKIIAATRFAVQAQRKRQKGKYSLTSWGTMIPAPKIIACSG